MKISLRRGLFVSAVGVMALGLTACGSTSGNNSSASNTGNTSHSSGSQKTMTFRLADDQPATYPTVKGDEAFAKEVSQKTNGRIKIKVYPNAQLGAENSVIQQIQLGAIDFGRINAAPLADFDKKLGVLELPYLFKSTKQEWDVYNGKVGSDLLNSLTTAKMVGLTFYDSGQRNFYNSKHAVKTPAQLKGLKIRVQKSNMMVDLVNTLGGNATPMAYSEVFNALQSGVIDGAENNIPSYYTTNHYKVAKYLTLDHHTATPEILLASQKTWNKLSPADQKIVRQAAQDSQKVERTAWNALVQKALKAIKANGNVITNVDSATWQKAVQPLYKKYGSSYSSIIQQIKNTN
ncbi:TRAP transporter substrate-binding protein [Alicyclobacillus sp. SO9]|uniref:TRAP transporter substrate-binding protein n=1 Tax=Alicyclobacillus sp. SO9 TaxID=2665646 RepID=UPI001E3B6276|nr:TRAP transporter substrate-binding protein [Alicyclobacillus sp. SO9]